jgi:E3 ubiquitin-protein ligase BAH
VVLQRQKKSRCPICRREVVMEADAGSSYHTVGITKLSLGNVDEELLRYLKLYFPKEVKAKQLENERAAGMDQLEKVGMGPRKKGECIIS